VQREVVHGADAQDAHAGKGAADAVHQGAAGRAEVVGHVLARGDGGALAEGLEVVAAAHVREVLVVDGEVGGEHRRGDLAAVVAVADEGLDEPRSRGWE